MDETGKENIAQPVSSNHKNRVNDPKRSITDTRVFKSLGRKGGVEALRKRYLEKTIKAKEKKDEIKTKEKEDEIRELKGHALEDPLTGLNNRRWFDQEIERKIKSSQRSKSPLYFIYIDFDDFKEYNTAYGHQGGDEVLKQMASLPSRDDEPIARIGGDEFAQLVNRDVTEKDIVEIIKRYQIMIAERNFIFENMQVIKKDLDPNEIPKDIALTYGVAKLEPTDTADEFLKRANEAAHHGKFTGKNTINFGEISSDETISFRSV
ncbi:MAG TPA: GGDEF domain-containing protein [Patescibacteria group bacterium]|nr:GGDEF domain-containing protein [Patescibacteria group bacterium]